LNAVNNRPDFLENLVNRGKLAMNCHIIGQPTVLVVKLRQRNPPAVVLSIVERVINASQTSVHVLVSASYPSTSAIHYRVQHATLADAHRYLRKIPDLIVADQSVWANLRESKTIEGEV
jgi:hypothetical protein